MPTPLTLPCISWGSTDAPRKALLVHGLGSSAALMWRLGVALADAGWHVTAPDLRGHGDAPRALDYSIAAYAADVAHTTTEGGWDAVIGHSLGGAASTAAAAAVPGWTRRLILIDPAIHVEGRNANIIRKSQERAFANNRLSVVKEEHPRWHPHDWELKIDAVTRGSKWAVEQTSSQNEGTWDVREQAAQLRVATHIIGADPEVYSLFTGDTAAEVLAKNPAITMSVVTGAGHSPHRDKPEDTIAQLMTALA